MSSSGENFDQIITYDTEYVNSIPTEKGIIAAASSLSEWLEGGPVDDSIAVNYIVPPLGYFSMVLFEFSFPIILGLIGDKALHDKLNISLFIFQLLSTFSSLSISDEEKNSFYNGFTKIFLYVLPVSTLLFLPWPHLLSTESKSDAPFVEIQLDFTVVVVMVSILHGACFLTLHLLVSKKVVKLLKDYVVSTKPFLTSHPHKFVDRCSRSEMKNKLLEHIPDIIKKKLQIAGIGFFILFDGLYSLIVLICLLYTRKNYNIITLELSTLAMSQASLYILNIVLWNAMIAKMETELEITTDLSFQICYYTPRESALISLLISFVTFIAKNFVF